MVFRCPKCDLPLGPVGDDGTLETVCAGCRYRYRIWQGRLHSRSSQQITLREPTVELRGAYRRSYEFRLAMPDGDIAVVAFDIPGRDDVIPFREGDTLAAAWSLRGGQLEELLYVMNRTSGRTFHVSAPGESARNRAVAIGALVFFSVFALTCTASDENVPLAFLMAVALGVGSGLAVGRRGQPTHELPPDTRAAIAASQSLLSRREELVRERAEVERDCRLKEDAITRLRALAAKMEAADPSLYAERLEVLRRGISAIERQLELERQLVDAHSRLIATLEIEAESASASLALDAATGEAIERKLEALRALREASAELERELRANDEVERMLRGSATP